jgi:hypothetical protein
VVDVYVSPRRATDDAAAFFRRAIESTGVVPDEVMTDGAAYPPALAVALPPVAHETGKAVQQRIERDYQHRQGRLRPPRGCCAARTPCCGISVAAATICRRRGRPAAAAGGAGVGGADGGDPGALTLAPTHRPCRACSWARCASAITPRPNGTSM